MHLGQYKDMQGKNPARYYDTGLLGHSVRDKEFKNHIKLILVCLC